jgi:hypothetical protein
MHQAAAKYWNQIAETQTLATEWAQQMFPLPQEQLDLALENEEQRVAALAGGDQVVAAAYLKVMPLLWEREAISRYLREIPSLYSAIPPIPSLTEAVQMAANDFQMSESQLLTLSKLLRRRPT